MLQAQDKEKKYTPRTSTEAVVTYEREKVTTREALSLSVRIRQADTKLKLFSCGKKDCCRSTTASKITRQVISGRPTGNGQRLIDEQINHK
jgi:hypothetical protein